jgi:cobalt transporter subunit CbtA
VIRETVLAAIVAGLIAAVVFTAVQSAWLTPLILQGEAYEDAAEAAHEHHESASSHHEEHHHDADAWKPKDGFERTLYTFGANLLMGVGYAFVLVALYLLWREPRNALAGAAYGLAGFLVFFVAPALGLPPELPGTAAADLAVRQQWWAMTAVATGAGLILLFSKSWWWLRAFAVLIIVAPHLFAAPHPEVESSLAPAELQTQFRIATTICNALFWLSLGLASSIAFQKWVVSPGKSGIQPPAHPDRDRGR